MTVASICILMGALLLYCGIKGRSVKNALLGKSVQSTSGSLLGSSS